MSDLVARLQALTTLRYGVDCKCGKCQAVPLALLQEVIGELMAARLISDNELAEAQDALETIQATLRHRGQPQDVTFHRGLKALRDARDWFSGAAWMRRQS